MTDSKPTCFIAMPITTHPAQAETYGDPAHWQHVMEHLFVPAIELAGFEPVRPITKGSYMIHDQIVKNLGECDLVLVDLSTQNPNVFFELGVRTSLNKPVCLIADEKVGNLPFDTSGINTERYDSALRPWTMTEQLQKVAEHIGESAESCHGTNPMWRQYGLTITAEQPSVSGDPDDARFNLILRRLDERDSLLDRFNRERAERIHLQNKLANAQASTTTGRSSPDAIALLLGTDEWLQSHGVLTMFVSDLPSSEKLAQAEAEATSMGLRLHLEPQQPTE